MQRLTLSDYALTIILLLALAFGVAYLLQTWLISLQTETTQRIERVNY